MPYRHEALGLLPGCADLSFASSAMPVRRAAPSHSSPRGWAG